MHYGKLLFCETVYSRGTCKEITLGTNFPLGSKSAARYLPKDTDQGAGGSQYGHRNKGADLCSKTARG